MKSFDMGLVKPGATLSVVCLNWKGDTLGSVLQHQIDVLPRPSWLSDATISGVQVSGHVISMQASYPIAALVEQRVPDTVTAIGKRRFSMFGGSVQMGITYNLDDRTSQVSDPAMRFGVNIFNQKKAFRSIPIRQGALSLDTNFNLSARVADSTYVKLFSIDVPTISIPISFFADIEFDAGLDFWATLKGSAVVGQQDGAWGFIKDGNDATGLSGKVYGSGWMRGGISVLLGLASVRGTLGVNGMLGGALTYVSVPASKTETLFGGNLSVWGELRAKVLWWTVATIGPKTLYQTSFGNLPGRTIRTEQDGAMAKSTTVQVNQAFEVPDHNPQPSLDSRNGTLVSAWLSDSVDHYDLWLAFLRDTASSFDPAVHVLRNYRPMMSPQASAAPDGSAFLAWCQSRYTSSTIPSNASLQNVVASQDIVVALYDGQTKVAGPPVTLEDDTTGNETGRAEAEPRICSIDDSHGVLVWLGRKAGDSTVGVWSSNLTRSGISLQASIPQSISSGEGTNRNLTITRLADHQAMAFWVNELPPGPSGTSDTRIMYSTYNGSSWTVPATYMVGVSPIDRFGEVAVSMSNDRYGVIASTFSTRDSNGHIDRTVNADIWDIQKGQWNSGTSYHHADTTADFQNLQVSISKYGKAAVSYQSIPRVYDSALNDNGRRVLALMDLQYMGNGWRELRGMDPLGNPASFVWSAQTAFGTDETFYELMEEKGDSIARNAKRFGERKLNLVLRAVHVYNDLTIGDVDEPGTPTGLSGVEGNERDLRRAGAEVSTIGNEIVLSYNVRQSSRVKIQLFDLRGISRGVILDQILEGGEYRTSVPTDGLANGAYMCQMMIDGDVFSKVIRIVQ